METFEAIEERRSVKYYDPDHNMTEEEVQKLLSSAMLSPTSFNIQNWRFVVIRDVALRKQLREAAGNQAQVTDGSLLIILCADLKSWENARRYWVNASKDVQDFLIPSIEQCYQDNEQQQRDEAMRSCGIAAQTLMLGAKAMGYDSCPMIGFDFVKIAQLINLPKDHIITMMITIGKALKQARPRGGQLPKQDVIIHDRFK